MADFKREGKIDLNQWRLFKTMFIDKFNEGDKDHNLKLNKEELLSSLADISQV
jgi:hypothetical protein